MRTSLRDLAWILVLALPPLLASAASAPAQEITQIPLTEKQVTALIGAQEDIVPLAGKLAEAGDKVDPELMKQLEEVAKKHGFASFEEYRNVDNNIFLVLEGLNRKTGEFTDPAQKRKDELEAEIANVNADDKASAEEKAKEVEEIKQDIAAIEPVKYKENVELVKKHLTELAKLMPEMEDEPNGDGGPGPEPAD